MEKTMKDLSEQLAKASDISVADARKILDQVASTISDDALLSVTGGLTTEDRTSGFLIA